MERLLIARHAHSISNDRDTVSCVPPGEGLSELGREQALELGRALTDVPVRLGAASRLARAQETLALALGDSRIPRIVLPELDDIHFGRFEGGPLAEYRAWAWGNPPETECPGAGESRVEAALRFARGLDALLAREESVALVVSHGLPVRYVVDASDGVFPAAQIGRVPHADAVALSREQIILAAETLRSWASEPRFR